MDTKQDEQFWVESFRNGDDEALSHFFKLNNRSLFYFANRLVRVKEEAEDIVADCFFKLWTRREDFETAAKIKAFLYISCRNECLDYLRRIKVKTVAQQNYFNQLSQTEETILYNIMESEFLEIVSQEIEFLPKKCQEVFKLIYFEGKKIDEIAEKLKLSAQTVRNHKTRAISLLKTAFLKKGMSSTLSFALLLFTSR